MIEEEICSNNSRAFMTEYRALIANCLIQGELPSLSGDTQIRNVIELQLDGFDVQIIEKPEFLINPYTQFDGRTLHTTDLVISDLSPSDFDRAETLAHEVARLLAFATVSEVWKFGYSYPNHNPSSFKQDIIGRISTGLPVINSRPIGGRYIRMFLKQAWPVYHVLREKRQLDIVTDYFVVSQLSRQPIEAQLIITFVLLENLKSTFALEKGYVFERNYFRRKAGDKEPLGFKELLQQMLAGVGMASDLSKIINLRNQLIHSGITLLSTKESVEIYRSAQDVVRKYLLRLFGYTGIYHLYLKQFPLVMA